MQEDKKVSKLQNIGKVLVKIAEQLLIKQKTVVKDLVKGGQN